MTKEQEQKSGHQENAFDPQMVKTTSSEGERLHLSQTGSAEWDAGYEAALQALEPLAFAAARLLRVLTEEQIDRAAPCWGDVTTREVRDATGTLLETADLVLNRITTPES